MYKIIVKGEAKTNYQNLSELDGIDCQYEFSEYFDKREHKSLIDKGEASAIALVLESDNSLLIIDDRKGRKFARQPGLSIIGTIGIIVDAKLTGIIPSVKPVLAKN